jgi:hypothetical protein
VKIERQRAAASLDLTTFVDANDILMMVANNGIIGRDLGHVFGNDYGTYYPYWGDTSLITGGQDVRSPLYSTGLWLGGRVDGEIRVSLAEYSSEFRPGPMIDSTFDPDWSSDSSVRVFKLHEDSLASNPNTDYLEWPSHLGAPVDSAGRPAMQGDQLLWCVYNDADWRAHDNDAGRTPGLLVEVRQSVWAGEYPLDDKTVFTSFEIVNKGPDVVDSMYIGCFFDPDLGGSLDDLVGCDPDNDMLYCYNADNDDDYYYRTPPAIGLRVLAGPLIESPDDTAVFGHNRIPGYDNAGLNSVKAYTNGEDPDSFEETYNLLKGLEKDGTPYQDPLSGQPTRFMYDGDPLHGGDIDPLPGDKRMLASMGPLTMNPGDSQFVLLCIKIRQSDDHMGSLNQLRSALPSEDYVPPFLESPIPPVPESFRLSQNYPNPFNNATRIEYDLPTASRVSIDVYNVLGQKVTNLVDETKPAGLYDVIWGGTDDDGDAVASGVYFYRLVAGEQVAARKMMLLK